MVNFAALRRTAAVVSGVLVGTIGAAGCAADHDMHVGASMAGMTSGVDGPVEAMPGGAMMVRSEADFLATMTAHHREAIVAAGQLARSERPELRALGRRIVQSQARQVRQMRAWLDRWYWPIPTVDHYRPMMSDLSALDGDTLDRTFLVEMIRHHAMAVMMSRRLLASGLVRHAQVARLARSVEQDQTDEIALMRRWLRSWA
jgi:uncharacterized protein (DUF305 family)